MSPRFAQGRGKRACSSYIALYQSLAAQVRRIDIQVQQLVSAKQHPVCFNMDDTDFEIVTEYQSSWDRCHALEWSAGPVLGDEEADWGPEFTLLPPSYSEQRCSLMGIAASPLTASVSAIPRCGRGNCWIRRLRKKRPRGSSCHQCRANISRGAATGLLAEPSETTSDALDGLTSCSTTAAAELLRADLEADRAGTLTCSGGARTSGMSPPAGQLGFPADPKAEEDGTSACRSGATTAEMPPSASHGADVDADISDSTTCSAEAESSDVTASASQPRLHRDPRAGRDGTPASSNGVLTPWTSLSEVRSKSADLASQAKLVMGEACDALSQALHETWLLSLPQAYRRDGSNLIALCCHCPRPGLLVSLEDYYSIFWSEVDIDGGIRSAVDDVQRLQPRLH
mmetsp:Transcript_72399/g.212122  ORF Transcript_72399/g.212122 Transcript_72399/m.212122 type:complete len:399 (+) Transcript_72399:78-1274(+)